MTIHFDVTEENGDRTLMLEGTDQLVGWIEQGRKMVGSQRTWTEWGFVSARGTDQYPVHDNIAAAYADARTYAATMVTAPDPKDL